jgi:tetratricopeptide (TPR) repeat protein
LYQAGHLPDAANVIAQALAAFRGQNTEPNEGAAPRVLSEIQRELGEPDESLRAAERAVSIALRLRSHVAEGFWLIALGAAQQANGQLGEALESYQRSAALHRRLGDRGREALAWHGAGETYRRMGREEEAVHRELGDRWHEAVALDGLAAALRETDPGQARRHWTAALRLIDDYDDPRAAKLRERIERDL